MSTYTTGYSKLRGPEHRRDKRLASPVFSVTIDGHKYQTLNWSLSGLLVSGYAGNLRAEDEVEVEIEAKDAISEMRMKVKGAVVRVNHGKNEMSIKFNGLSPEVYSFFEKCFMRRLHRKDSKR